MTRQEEIHSVSNQLSELYKCSKTFKMGFEEGAQWADEHPKSPWISVKDKLPCDDKNLIHFEFTNSVLAYDENFSFLIAWMKKNSDNTWIWHTKNKDLDLHLSIIYWMPFPKPPKK